MKLVRFLFAFGSVVTVLGCASPAPHITVEWTTASEIDTVGFNIYRSENPEGPFVKVNAETIANLGNSVLGSRYQFEDGNVAYDKPYFYLVEDIELGGATERHGPISAAAHRAISEHEILLIGSAILVLGILAPAIENIALQ